MEIINWLNDNSGAVTGISSIITSLATVVLVVITGWYVRLTEKLKATYKPEVLVSIDYLERVIRGVFSMAVSVKNLGQGVARKVKFGGDISFSPCGNNPLQEIDFLKDGYDVLPPGGGGSCRISGALKPLSDFDAQRQTLVVITVTYEDSVKNKYADTFRFDFSDRILPSA